MAKGKKDGSPGAGRPKGATGAGAVVIAKSTLTAAQLERVKNAAKKGVLNRFLAHGLGVDPTQFPEFLRDNPQVAEAINKGRWEGIERITQILWDKIEASGDMKAIAMVMRYVGGYNELELEQQLLDHAGVAGHSADAVGRVRGLLERYRKNKPESGPTNTN